MGYGPSEPGKTFRCPVVYLPTVRELYMIRRGHDKPDFPDNGFQCMAEFERQEELDRHLRLVQSGEGMHWHLMWVEEHGRNGRRKFLRRDVPPKNLAWLEWQIEKGFLSRSSLEK